MVVCSFPLFGAVLRNENNCEMLVLPFEKEQWTEKIFAGISICYPSEPFIAFPSNKPHLSISQALQPPPPSHPQFIGNVLVVGLLLLLLLP